MPPVSDYVAFGDEVSDDEDTPETLAALAKEDRGEAQFSPFGSLGRAVV